MKKIFLNLIISLSMICALLPPVAINAEMGAKNTTISIGIDYAAAIKNDGTLWMWGANSYGSLGTGSENASYIPIKVLENVKSVSLGLWHSAAIKNDGSLWMWGNTQYGKIGGNGIDNIALLYPRKVMENIVSVELGQDYSAAVDINGSLWMWGNNSQGQLGNGSTTSTDIPIKIMEDVQSVSLGDYHSAAIKNDGTLWMWGLNSDGQLGIGNEADSAMPVKVMDNVKFVDLGRNHSAAIKKDGSLWLWGSDYYDQLGNEKNKDYSSIPIKIMDNVVHISLSQGYSMAVKTDGSLWAWGENMKGQFGNGTTSFLNPTPLKVNEGIVMVEAHDGYCIAVKAGGSLWSWGENYSGQLGDGTVENRLNPTKIMDNVMLPNQQVIVNKNTPSDWAKNNIDEAIRIGLIPEELQCDWQTPITRLDFCKLAETLCNIIIDNINHSPTGQFEDTTTLSDAEKKTITAVSSLGIINGYDDGTFRPYGDVTRQEAAAMLMRTRNAIKVNDFPDTINAEFTDCWDCGDWGIEAIKYVYGYNIMNGVDETYSNGTTLVTFNPFGKYTREQAMVTFLRVYNDVKK